MDDEVLQGPQDERNVALSQSQRELPGSEALTPGDAYSVLKSSSFYFYSPISQIFLKGLYNVYII